MSDFETFCEELEKAGGKYTVDKVRMIMNPSYQTPEEKWERVKEEVIKSYEYKRVMYNIVSAASYNHRDTIIKIEPEDKWVWEINKLLREDGYEVYNQLDEVVVCW
jgi:hypothetical protein